MKTIKENLVFANEFAKIFNNDVEFKNGLKGTHFLVETSDSVSVLPITTDGKFVLVDIERYGMGGFSLEFPAGGINEGETSHDASKRELSEETGMEALKMTHHFTSIANPSIQSSHSVGYIGWGCQKAEHAKEADPLENIGAVRFVTASELYELCTSGKIVNASTLATAMSFFMSLSPVKPKELDDKNFAFIMGVYNSAIGKNKMSSPFRNMGFEKDYTHDFEKGFNHHHHTKVVR
ncbi:NUDIX hydrolase [Vibrio crassostreae]|uniref:NUDIX hydrolase n=1 Tax=Vibrio crassostreae TaxID=246167 RepID=UPI001B3016A2|nr:NUDIX hydrolase [Vibrio crassostreae]